MGFYLSKANTFSLINLDELRRELVVRHIRCEVPGCNVQAIAIVPLTVSFYACAEHASMCENRHFAKVLQGVVVTALKHEMFLASNAAYEASDNELVVSFDGSKSLAAITEQALTPRPQKKLAPQSRPTLNTLAGDNATSDDMDLFIA